MGYRGRNAGPRLPEKLLRELGEGGGLSAGRVSRKDRRKQERQNKKLRSKRLGDVETGERRVALKRQSESEVPGTEQNRKKKKKKHVEESRQQQGQRRGTTYFDELIPASQRRSEGDTEDPEKVLQMQLAKKLGMKSTELKKNEDGLDDLLNELDDIMMGDMGGSSDSEGDYDEFNSGSDFEVDDCDEADDRLGEDFSLGEEDSDVSDPCDSEEEKIIQNVIEDKKPSTDAGTKYVPPALRKASSQDDEQEAAVGRRVRGLVNRMTEANMEGIVSDLCTMYVNEGRSYVSRALSHELVSASSQGPRASEKFAIVAAACIASLGAEAESPEVIATFLSRLGKDLEKSLRENDSLAVSNLVRLLGCLFLSKAIKTDLMFDLLNSWGDAFTDQHVLAIAGLLTVAGLALRKSEPTQMKNFVVEIHEKASKHGEITTRARVMLDLVVDVKNNRMKDRKGALSISTNGSATLASALPPNVAAWFKTCNVDSVAIGGIPWSKVVSSSQKGFWWIPTLQDKKMDDGVQTGMKSNGIVDSQHGQESDFVSNAELLKLAVKLRMSTDTRRAIFLAVMGSEDAIDAAEKLLRLNLKGQQEREIVRVIVECCMHESAWNLYYGMVLNRLCQLAKGHRVTLQYCLWDHIKDINRMNARKISIFSKLCAYIVMSKTLPLSSVIKVVSFSDLSAKELLVWRVFFKALLEDISSDDVLRSVLSKLAEQKDMTSLKKQVRVFLMTKVGPWLANKSSNGSNSKEEKQLMSLLTRCNKAERFLK